MAKRGPRAAHVHVVIIGFSVFDPVQKNIYSEDENGVVSPTPAANISPYLIDGPNKALLARSEPPKGFPRMSWGNKPTDGGHLILSEEERDEILKECPDAARFVRRYMSGGDFIDGNLRFCLWLVEAKPEELRALRPVRERIAKVRAFRLASKASTTREYATRPALFRQIAQPVTDYLAIPEISSEKRPYIPIAVVSRKVICSNTVQFIADAETYHFGVLTSLMHMGWVKLIAGRLESRYRYSNTLVYNNFPWPQNVAPSRKHTVENLAQAVLDVRALHPNSTLADLYDPISMPPELTKAHQKLDRAVERCYRPEPFTSDRERVEFLFTLYEQLTAQQAAPLLPAPTPRRRRRAV